MPLFYMRTLPVEAYKWDGPDSIAGIKGFYPNIRIVYTERGPAYYINVYDGDTRLEKGHYIYKTSSGSYCVLSEEAFLKKYEQADED